MLTLHLYFFPFCISQLIKYIGEQSQVNFLLLLAPGLMQNTISKTPSECKHLHLYFSPFCISQSIRRSPFCFCLRQVWCKTLLVRHHLSVNICTCISVLSIQMVLWLKPGASKVKKSTTLWQHITNWKIQKGEKYKKERTTDANVYNQMVSWKCCYGWILARGKAKRQPTPLPGTETASGCTAIYHWMWSTENTKRCISAAL